MAWGEPRYFLVGGPSTKFFGLNFSSSRACQSACDMSFVNVDPEPLDGWPAPVSRISSTLAGGGEPDDCFDGGSFHGLLGPVQDESTPMAMTMPSVTRPTDID